MEMAMKDTRCTRLIGDVEYQPRNDTNKQVWSRVKKVHGTVLIDGVTEEYLGIPKGLVVQGWAPRVVRITNNHILRNIDALLHIEVYGPEPWFWFQNNSKFCRSDLREEIEARISGTIEWDETCDSASTQYDTTENTTTTTSISVGSTATTTAILIESTLTTVSPTAGTIEGTETTIRGGGLDYHEYVEIEQGTGSSFIGIEHRKPCDESLSILFRKWEWELETPHCEILKSLSRGYYSNQVYQVYDDVIPVIEGETPVYEESSQRTPDAHANEDKKSAEDSQSNDAIDTKGAKVIAAPSDKRAKSAST
ncbi:unnamed protein product [Haemonchus placei]|uniref:DUF4283 domain-containing protein n=1 Tax=Haemonchus placei TaxID=6290 RepID=A0A0N4WZM2_HAEPC|nr:unnamed protein product [Haemonchus placei]